MYRQPVPCRFAQRGMGGLVAFAALLTGACRPSAAEVPADHITVWAHHGQAAEHAAMQRIVADFNAAYAVDGPVVRVSFFPDRQYADKVAIASATGRLPDVLEIDGPYVGPWAAEGLLVPLDDQLDETQRSDFLPTILAQGTYQERLYALGAFDSALVVYYNRDIVQRAGLNPPRRVAEAWSWDEFVDALQRVKPHAALPLSLHMDDPGDEWLTYAFAPLIWSNGGRLIDSRHQRVTGALNAAVCVSAVERWQRLFTEGLAEPTATTPDPFAAGLAAFDWTGHWMLPGFEQTAGLDFGAMPIPRIGAESVTSAGSWCWGISRDCRRRDQAWRFIAWLLDPRTGIKPLVEANGAVPGRRSAFQYFPNFESGPRCLFREQLEASARARPRTAVYLALTSAFARALRDVSLGADVQTALDQAAGSVQLDLDRRSAREALDR